MSTRPGQAAAIGVTVEAEDCARSLDFYLEAIRLFAPQLQVRQARSILLIQEGWDSLVLDVDGCVSNQAGQVCEMIIRFPRFAQIRDAYRKEAQMLPELQRLLPVPVPVFEVAHLDDEDPCRCFVAYRKLPGASISPADLLQAGGQDGRDAPLLVDQLAGFLRVLHSISLQDAGRILGLSQPELAASVGLQAWHQKYIHLYTWIQQEAYPFFTEDQVERCRRLWEPRLAASEQMTFTPALIHADLGPEHILVDHASAPANAGRLAGIIDWEDAQIGDPALDFAGLISLECGTALDALVVAYQVGQALPARDAGLLERAAWYRAIAPYYEIQYGLLAGKSHHLEEGLRQI